MCVVVALYMAAATTVVTQKRKRRDFQKNMFIVATWMRPRRLGEFGAIVWMLLQCPSLVVLQRLQAPTDAGVGISREKLKDKGKNEGIVSTFLRFFSGKVNKSDPPFEKLDRQNLIFAPLLTYSTFANHRQTLRRFMWSKKKEKKKKKR